MKKILYIICALLVISCDKTPHLQESDQYIILDEDAGSDPTVGVVLGFDTDGVTSTDIEDLNVFFFDESEKLTRHNYFSSMTEVAYTKLLMESGEYTAFAVFNTEEDFLTQVTKSTDLPELYLSGLISKINGYYDDDTYPNMLTGMTQVSVDGSITQAIITITDEPVTDNITVVSLDLVYPSSDLPAYTKSSTTPTLRAVVELYQSGTTNRMYRKTYTYGEEMTLTLTSGDYDVRVWSDYTLDKDTDLYYNSEQTNNISILSKEGYTANTDYKDAFAGVSTLTTDGAEMNHTHTLKRPFAKYKIIATDVEEYEAMRESRGYPELDDLSIEIIYEGYLPTAYNMVDAILCGADTGYSFNSEITGATDTEATLATDYVFVNGSGSSVSVTIYIKDADGNTISAVSGNTIEYKADYLTTISGGFLTAGKGGITIDTDWGGDFNVTF